MGGETPGHGSEEWPHTRARAGHWAATAAAVAALVVSVVLAGPAAGVSASPPRSSAALGRSVGPDPADARYPLDCAGAPVAVAKQISADLDGDGRAETAAAVHCQAGTGNPPHALYVLSRGTAAGSPPRVVASLLGVRQGLNVTGLAVHGGELTANTVGYSSPDVPRCCPDLKETLAWHWNSGRFVAVPQAPAATV